MNWSALAELIAGQTGTAAEIAEWCNEAAVWQRSPHYVSYRTILWALQGDVATRTARLEAIRAAVEATMPTIHAMLMGFGGTDGSAGGLNVADEGTRAYLASLATEAGGNLLATEEAAALCGLGLETITRATAAGLPMVLAGDVARLTVTPESPEGE